MSVFDPDDFHNDPYTGGLNQLGHVVFGAALVVMFGLVGAVVAFVAWELYQVRFRGGRVHDFAQDAFFWYVGATFHAHDYLPVIAVASGAIWMFVLWMYQRS